MALEVPKLQIVEVILYLYQQGYKYQITNMKNKTKTKHPTPSTAYNRMTSTSIRLYEDRLQRSQIVETYWHLAGIGAIVNDN